VTEKPGFVSAETVWGHIKCAAYYYSNNSPERERKRKNMDFSAIFSLPFHSMPTIQSQEMLCQGTKGGEKNILEQEL